MIRVSGALRWLGSSAVTFAMAISGTSAVAKSEPWFCPKVEARVAVVGDSLADGLWAALFRAWRGCQSVTLFRVTKVSDGLTLTAPGDWAGRLAASLGEFVADVVVVQVGANDIRPVRMDGGRVMFGSPEWDLAYADRGHTLLADLRQMADSVVWVGLPVVGDEILEAAYTRVSGVQASLVADRAASDPETIFVDIHEATGFGTGGYIQSVTLGESLTQLRATDRIHFTNVGYDMVALLFRRNIEQRLLARDNSANLNALALQ